MQGKDHFFEVSFANPRQGAGLALAIHVQP